MLCVSHLSANAAGGDPTRERLQCADQQSYVGKSFPMIACHFGLFPEPIRCEPCGTTAGARPLCHLPLHSVQGRMRRWEGFYPVVGFCPTRSEIASTKGGQVPSDIQAKFEQQFPRPDKLSFELIFGYIAGLASIAGLIGAPFVITEQTHLSFLYLTSLTVIVAVLLVYALLINRRKLHRYAQSVIFTHYVNHIIRDALQEIQTSEVKVATQKVLNAIATCFSIITAKQCRACVVELTKDFELVVMARDDISGVMSRKKPLKHFLDDNTDFYNLWYAKSGCSRFFMSNDLRKLWKQHKYRNSSFQELGEPHVQSVLGIDVVRNWQLPYRSAMVFPIRYISRFQPPESRDENPEHWKYWGFLCVDCNTSSCFDDRYCPDLGGAFADSLYTLFSQSYSMLDLLTRPKN